jgi:hypothetical protein
MKNIEIELIQDTRFTNSKSEAKKTVETWVNQITENLKFLIGVETQTKEIREINFSEPEPCISYRQKIYIRRINCKYKATLNQIYEAVNKVKPCYFKKVN